MLQSAFSNPTSSCFGPRSHMAKVPTGNKMKSARIELKISNKLPWLQHFTNLEESTNHHLWRGCCSLCSWVRNLDTMGSKNYKMGTHDTRKWWFSRIYNILIYHIYKLGIHDTKKHSWFQDIFASVIGPHSIVGAGVVLWKFRWAWRYLMDFHSTQWDVISSYSV